MKNRSIPIGEMALIIGTRALIGGGLGLLLGGRLSQEKREAAGWTLLALGLLSTIPLGFDVLGNGKRISIETPEQPLLRSATPAQAAVLMD